MDGRLDIDSFEKAITGLNKNLSDVGLLFRANMPLLATDATQETKENCVDKMSDRIAELLDSFRESYSYYNDFYEKMKENIRNDNIENPEEYDVFFNHANETFPKYIDEHSQRWRGRYLVPEGWHLPSLTPSDMLRYGLYAYHDGGY